MLDGFEILTTSGIVLWRRHYTPISSNLIDSLVRDVFIEEKQKPGGGENGAPSYKKDRYTLRWTSAKDVGLVFVVGEALRSHTCTAAWHGWCEGLIGL